MRAGAGGMTQGGILVPGGGGGPVEWEFIGDGTHGVPGGGGNQTINLPGGTQEGDIVIVGRSCDNDTTNLTIVTAGYTVISENHAVGDPDYYVALKIMGASPDANVEVNAGDTGNSSPTVVQVWRGVDIVTPQDATATVANGASGMPNGGAITTATDEALVFVFGGLDDVDSTPTAPSGYSNLTFVNGTIAAGSCSMIASRIVPSAGAEDPPIFGGAESETWRTVTIALRKAT